MKAAPFSLYRVENVITEESARHGDYASSEPTDAESASFREALDALDSDCWDNVELSTDTVICYPADYTQDIRTGDYSASELIITARRPEWASRLLDCWTARTAAKPELRREARPGR